MSLFKKKEKQMKIFDFHEGEVIAYLGEDTEVEIPDNINGDQVVKIGIRAFSNKNLTSVSIPWGVVEIGARAFEDNRLINLKIPRSVASIGDGAFGNNQLTDVFIPNSVESMGEYVFDRNPMSSASIPGDMTMGTGAFPAGVNITSRDSAEKLFVISPWGEEASISGYRGEVTDLVIPRIIDGLTVTSIGVSAFRCRGLKRVTLPDTLENIYDDAFSRNQLTTIIIPESVTGIYDHAFEENQLTSVTLSKNITKLGPGVFTYNRLTHVSVPIEVMSQSMNMKMALMQAFDAGVQLTAF